MGRMIPKIRGIRIRPYMRYMKQILWGLLFFLCLIPIASYAYINQDKLIIGDYWTIGIVGFLVLFVVGISYYLAKTLIERTILFAKWDRLQRLARFLYEHNYIYEKTNQNKGKKKFKFPRIYVKQNKFDLDVSFELAGSKFQDKFKKIGGDLETTFAMDFMETEDDDRFKLYRLAYSALKSRIKATDVRWVTGKGIELMDGFYWDFISDPHMLVVGGTGGGKTVLLRTLILALSKIGVVDICDPKRADFATMTDIPAFDGRVVYDIDKIVDQFEYSLKIMEERYDFMRSEQKRLGHKDMKSFIEYGLEPYFLVCDEFNALKAMLTYKDIDRLDKALGQFLLLGRQAGCFAIIAMQKPSREDLGSKLQANINFRIAVGRLDEMGYDITFEEVNRNKEFKFMKFVGGMRVYGRGYAAVKGQVAREFYSPLLTKGLSFYDEYMNIERREHKHYKVIESEKMDMIQVVPPQPKKEEKVEKIDDSMRSINDISKSLGKSFAQIRNLLVMMEEEGFKTFEKINGKYMLSIEDEVLLETLFDLKEDSALSWKELVIDYFSVEE